MATKQNDVPRQYPAWHNLVAGAMAGVGARLATAPLDLVRIRNQLDRSVVYPRPSIWGSFVSIAKDEGGVLALFRGSVAATYLWVGYSAVQFVAYGSFKTFLEEQADNNLRVGGQEQQQQQRRQQQLLKDLQPTVVAFTAGGMAGICATLSTYPFDICRTIFAAQGVSSSSPPRQPSIKGTGTGGNFLPPKTLYEFALSLYHRRGLRAFYAGSTPALVQIVPYMGMNFAIYDKLTQGDTRVSQSGYAGSISGTISKVIVYPMDTVKKRLQAQAVFGPSGDVYEGMVDCIIKIYRHEGLPSFYRGILPSVLKTGIATGLSFSIYRWTKNNLESIHDSWNREKQQTNSDATALDQ